MSNKKGELDHELMTKAYDLIMVSMIFMILLGYVMGLEDQNLMKKEYLSRDIALLTDTLYAMPYNLPYVYEGAGIRLSDFNFDFAKGKVGVVEESIEEGTPAKIYYPFGLDNTVSLHYSPQLQPQMIEFRRTPDALYIGQEPPDDRQRCPGPDTSLSGWKNIPVILDPGHGGSDKGYMDIESDINAKLAREIENYLSTYEISTLATKDYHSSKAITIEERLGKLAGKETGPLFSIHTGYDSNKYLFPITLYVSTQELDKNRKLACLLKKNLDKNLNAHKIEIRYTDPKMLPPEDPLRILEYNGIGILMEMGNANYHEKWWNSKESGLISRSVKETVVEYYEQERIE